MLPYRQARRELIAVEGAELARLHADGMVSGGHLGYGALVRLSSSDFRCLALAPSLNGLGGGGAGRPPPPRPSPSAGWAA